MTDTYLPQRETPWQVSTDVPDAAGSVQLLGTTAPAWKSLGNPEWTADLEFVWRSRVTAPMKVLNDRAKARRKRAAVFGAILADDPSARQWSARSGLEAEVTLGGFSVAALQVTALRSAEWAEHRARALAMARMDVLSACGRRWRSVRCGCGTRDLRVGCDQPQLCGDCRRRHSQKWQKKIARGMAAGLSRERAAWHRAPKYRRRGKMPGVYLITLTAPHSGDLATDRDAMGKAVRKLLKHAEKYDWWRTYALTWEATSGRDGLGHMHCHLAVVSSWVPYRRKEVATDEDQLARWDSESPAARPRPPRVGRRKYQSERGLHDVWRDAMPGALVLDVKAPRSDADDASSAAGYLAKYVTKGVDPADFTGRKAGELLVAFRTRRKVSTSAHFWTPPDTTCECCGEAWRSMGAPCSLQQLAPGPVLRSMAERAGWWIPRGDPQVALRW